MVAIILIDNYEELLQSARENERSQIMGEIEYQIECYVENYNGVIKKLEKDRYFVAFEERYMRSIVEERFTILDTVRKINANDKMPATLSIGVGRDAQSLLQAEKFASQALDMALGRGGDQAAVKIKTATSFTAAFPRASRSAPRLRPESWRRRCWSCWIPVPTSC